MLKLCLALPVFYPIFGGGPLRFLRYQPGLRKRDIHARILAGTARSKDDFHVGYTGHIRRSNAGLDGNDYPLGSMLPI